MDTAKLLTIIISISLCASAVFADGWKQRKWKRRIKANHEFSSCGHKYFNRCSEDCYDKRCMKLCAAEAPGHCRAKKKARRKKQKRLARKAERKAARRAERDAILEAEAEQASNHTHEEPVDTIGPDILYTPTRNPYSTNWDDFSFEWDFGAGQLEENGTALTTNLKLRKKWFGFGANYAHLSEDDDYFTEFDFGPTLNFGSRQLTLALQPSMMVADGKDVETQIGFGMRAYNRLNFGQLYFAFDPMLGKIDDTYHYQVKMGGGYRFTPNVGLSLMYERRALLDSEDISVSQANLKSVMANLQVRFN